MTTDNDTETDEDTNTVEDASADAGEVDEASGKKIPTGKATVDPSNKKMMIVPLKDQLAPGDYKVQWYAVSDDTHKVKGSYSFSVAQ